METNGMEMNELLENAMVGSDIAESTALTDGFNESDDVVDVANSGTGISPLVTGLIGFGVGFGINCLIGFISYRRLKKQKEKEEKEGSLSKETEGKTE